MRKKVILRADGNSQIGLGHIYRLLALAEMLKGDFNCVFAINDPDAFVLNEIKKSCSSHINLNNRLQYQMPDLMKAEDEIQFDVAEYLSGNEIVVTDGYLFKESYQLAAKLTGVKLVCIDDLAVNDFLSDVVINHAPGVDRSLYKIQPGTALLTGLDYALIRQSFFRPFTLRKNAEINAFVSLGGSDYFQYTKKLIGILLEDNGFDYIHVLTSSSFSSTLLSDLDNLKSTSLKVKLHHNLNADDLVNLMDSCTHAFVAASTILIESYSRGLKCFAGYYVENQKFIYNGFINEGLAVGLGNFDKVNKEMVANGLKKQNTISPLTSPFSSREILKTFYSLCELKKGIEDLNYKLREVVLIDSELLFEWANDREVRNSAINTQSISFEEHRAWFNKRFNSVTCKMFILELDNQPAGQIRFEFNDMEKVWEIDYSISKKFRGLGLGKLIVKDGIDYLQQFPLAAYVKEENTRSQNVFNALGFTNMGLHEKKNATLLKYIKILPNE